LANHAEGSYSFPKPDVEIVLVRYCRILALIVRVASELEIKAAEV